MGLAANTWTINQIEPLSSDPVLQTSSSFPLVQNIAYPLIAQSRRVSFWSSPLSPSPSSGRNFALNCSVLRSSSAGGGRTRAHYGEWRLLFGKKVNPILLHFWDP